MGRRPMEEIKKILEQLDSNEHVTKIEEDGTQENDEAVSRTVATYSPDTPIDVLDFSFETYNILKRVRN